MNLRIKTAGPGGLSRRIAISLLAALLMLTLLGLSGCGKKQHDADIETGTEIDAPVISDPVVQPPAEIPVTDEQAEPEQVQAPVLQLQPVFFDFDKFALSETAREALNTNGRLLKNAADVRVLIEGHCDERGTSQYNLALGEKRAQVARDYLMDLGVAGARIEVVSYGKERPFAGGHDEAAWSQNRRAHFVQREAKR
jgi:peptidoglycan-associated lipoprotein